jgi:N-glycosylase/DNA lyase
MRKLAESVKKLKQSEVGRTVDSRIREFRRPRQSEELFKELCFCILTANFNAERSIRIQDRIGNGFISLPEPELARKLKELGHRFPNTRAKYIAEARKHCGSLKKTLGSFEDEKKLREWLVSNVKGLGMKEASHFLRNVGYEDLAIVDFHIADLLAKHGLIEKPKTITPKKYLEIEGVLRQIAKKTGLSMAELDLYLWFCETGKVLK